MDQIKIGKFIAACRKEEGMTQAELAEKQGAGKIYEVSCLRKTKLAEKGIRRGIKSCVVYRNAVNSAVILLPKVIISF